MAALTLDARGLGAALLGLVLSLSGCVTATAPAVRLQAQQAQLLRVSQGQTQVVYRAETEIEALGVAAPWVLWAEDDQPALRIAKLDDDRLTPANLPPLPHDADLLCLGPLNDGVYDLFVHDGDGLFHHYWLNPEANTLHPVRTLAVNPDISACTVAADAVYFADPYIGSLRFDREPETDPVIHLVATGTVPQLRDRGVLETPVVAGALPLESGARIRAHAETAPVADAGDAADDPAILVAKTTTWIAGTNKQRGLAVYGLDGTERHFIARGRVNNVDAIAQPGGGFLLAASNRTERTIDVYRADPDRDEFAFLAAIDLTLDDPYGLCMASIDGETHVFVGDSEALVEHWRVSADYTGERLSQWRFQGQTEGCVMDPTTGQFYVGEEDTGIWRIDLASGERTLMTPVDGSQLVADVEGMDIYRTADQAWLIASSQGDDSYVVYQLDPWRQVAKFQVVANPALGLDGSSETDGLAVSALPSPGFPQGMLVVQDGRNRAPLANQNYKMIDWRDLDALITGAQTAR